jgi:hypothetical protein
MWIADAGWEYRAACIYTCIEKAGDGSGLRSSVSRQKSCAQHSEQEYRWLNLHTAMAVNFY